MMVWNNKGYGWVLFLIYLAYVMYWREMLFLTIFVGFVFISYRLIFRKNRNVQHNPKIQGRETPEDIAKATEEVTSVKSNWDKIEIKDISSFNGKLTKKDFIRSYVDENGYERNYRNRLIHRIIAYRFLYNKFYPKPFGTYQVHHKDRNKRNNSPENLQILTKKEHEFIHSIA